VLAIDVLIVGAGPAGLRAAASAGSAGASVVVVDAQDRPGGQLIKQTHKFFGSRRQLASRRGIDIAGDLYAEARSSGNVVFLFEAHALGRYPDGMVLVEHHGRVSKFRPRRLILTTGARERPLAFPNNDLPGIYGAGAVQTLMNVYGVKPACRVLMVGAGNIGLIVSYQLAQAGVEVAAVVEAASVVGGYAVHAARIRRNGIEILTSHTIREALGTTQVEAVHVHALDAKGRSVAGSTRRFEVDAICVAVGLTPEVELLRLSGCCLAYVSELGGHVPMRSTGLETSVPGVYVAGDAAGIEEASSAMVEGTLAGAHAAASLGYGGFGLQQVCVDAAAELSSLRAGPFGERIRRGLQRVELVGGKSC